MSKQGTSADDLLASKLGFRPSADVIARMSPEARAALGIDTAPATASTEAHQAAEVPSSAPEEAPLSRMAARRREAEGLEGQLPAPVPHWAHTVAWTASALIAVCFAFIAFLFLGPGPTAKSATGRGTTSQASATGSQARPAGQDIGQSAGTATAPVPATPAPADGQATGQPQGQQSQVSSLPTTPDNQQAAPQPTQAAQPQAPVMLEVTGWACAPGGNCGPLMDDGHGTLVQILPAPGVTCDASGRCNPPNCPPVLQGRVTAINNRIAVQVGVTGPAGFAQASALIDTGAGATILPRKTLEAAGYKPTGAATPLYGVSTTPVMAYTYKIMTPYVQDNGRWAAFSLATTPITVYGVDSGSFASTGLIGPDMLRAARLTVQGSAWALSLPCGN